MNLLPHTQLKIVSVLLALTMLLPVGTAQGFVAEHDQVPPSVTMARREKQPTLGQQPLPLQYAVSAAMGQNQNAYHLQQIAQGPLAETPSQGLSTIFGPEGIAVTAGQTQLGMRLSAIGYGDHLQGVEAVQPQVEANRVEYRRGNLTEWYVNGPLGLQQGFTLDERPDMTGLKEQPLTLVLALSHGWQSEVAAGGRNLVLTGLDGGTRLRYGGLLVTDAAGQELAARFETSSPLVGGGRELSIRIDDTSARYPLTIDPFIQQAYLKASNAEGGDQFGESVAISGDTVVVGAPTEDGDGSSTSDNSANASGAAYVFVRSGSTWSQQAYLKASNVGASDAFGDSVAISGDTVVVGAPWEASDGSSQSDNSTSGAGAAYVFVRSGGAWSQQAYLKASNVGGGDLFGYSVAISGDAVVVGAVGEASDGSSQSDDSAYLAGAAYIFVRSGGAWSQQAYLKASNAEVNDWLGRSVAISGDTVVAGAYNEDSDGSSESDNSAGNSGAAYIFVRSGGAWSQQAYLKASNVGASDAFGQSVAISGDAVVVGAFGEDSDGSSESDNSATVAGAAYIFVRSGGAWSQQAYLKASNAGRGDNFGRSVAISGEAVVVGAHNEDSDGSSESDNSAEDAGVAYVFERSGSTWSQQAYLKASNAEGSDGSFLQFGDLFGQSVAISGYAVVVGAVGEDSDGSSESDNSAPEAGAAYVFAELVERGDCNGDGNLMVSDIIGNVIELNDGDGEFWLDAPGGTYPGSPRGCDSNPTTLIRISDVICTVLVVNGGDTSCTQPPTLLSSTTAGAGITIDPVTAQAGLPVHVPVTLNRAGQTVAVATFSLQWDPQVLTLDSQDTDADGIPDGIDLHVADDFTVDITVDDGLMAVTIVDMELPLAQLPDGPLLTLAFTPNQLAAGHTQGAAISFGTEPVASLGSVEGVDIPVITQDAAVTLGNPTTHVDTKSLYLPHITQ